MIWTVWIIKQFVQLPVFSEFETPIHFMHSRIPVMSWHLDWLNDIDTNKNRSNSTRDSIPTSNHQPTHLLRFHTIRPCKHRISIECVHMRHWQTNVSYPFPNSHNSWCIRVCEGESVRRCGANGKTSDVWTKPIKGYMLTRLCEAHEHTHPVR